ncbi:MAG: sigma-70 family RNA polymerase sigma factor [Clostridia bacterium]|nr:sigma-70 family RNA polymerase sigma factor [Clostridia bacterium]
MIDVTEYFNTVYDATFRDLMRFCLMKARVEDAHDLLQNTYAKFYRHILRRGAGSIRDPRAYLMTVLKHETARLYRTRARITELPLESAENEAADTGSPEDLSLGRAAAQEIMSAIKTEPELTQRVFLLYYGYGMKLGDIAKETGTTEAGVRSRLKRVRKKLRSSLGEENQK